MSISLRITPARAGNRLQPHLLPAGRPDHPRACGEQKHKKPLPYPWYGSPPRVRGTVCCRRWDDRPGRITPARAGNSLCGSGATGLVKDHPRACGEQRARPDIMGLPWGSPPRVRGTDTAMEPGHGVGDITPARAGNRQRQNAIRMSLWDHPRACGEQIQSLMIFYNCQGSPPRVRGTAMPFPKRGASSWITPARAGNSYSILASGYKL